MRILHGRGFDRALVGGLGCHRYYFVFTDSGGSQVTFPTTGSLGIGPAGSCHDWSLERPALGNGCDCAADCSERTCGDDGYGKVQSLCRMAGTRPEGMVTSEEREKRS